MTLKKYKIHLRATLTVYAENPREAMNEALDYSSDLYKFGEFEIDESDIDEPILQEVSL